MFSPAGAARVCGGYMLPITENPNMMDRRNLAAGLTRKLRETTWVNGVKESSWFHDSGLDQCHLPFGESGFFGSTPNNRFNRTHDDLTAKFGERWWFNSQFWSALFSDNRLIACALQGRVWASIRPTLGPLWGEPWNTRTSSCKTKRSKALQMCFFVCIYIIYIIIIITTTK